MKKIICTIVAILSIATTYCQNLHKVVRVSKLEYSNQEWVKVAEEFPQRDSIAIEGWDITVSNHRFKAFGEYEKVEYTDHDTYTWKGLNSASEECYLVIKKFKSELASRIIFTIVYTTGVLYEYETE